MKKMLKVLLAVCVGMFILAGCDASPVPDNAPRSTVQVISLPGMTTKEIMKKVNLWIAEHATSYNSIVQYKTANTIVVKANSLYPCDGIECMAKAKWRIWYMMKVDVKPSKMRVSFSSFELETPSRYDSTFGYTAGNRGTIHLKGDLEKAIQVANMMRNDLITYVKSSTNSDW